jgi:translocation and assembly module TamA
MRLSTERVTRIVAAYAAGLACITVAAGGCATIPKGQYGVNDVEWIGMKDLSSEALESCLVTRKREAVNIRLGLGSPSCGQPPFDSKPPSFDLWSMPWSEWPVYDPAIFDVERERIERWYQARGYYQARVIDVMTLVDGKPVDPNECHASGSDCKLKLVVKVSEGEPTRIKQVEIESSSALPPALLAKLRKKLQLLPGERFDESSYEADKADIKFRLVNASYARVKVSGKVLIDREKREAHVIYRIEPGPTCVFGSVTVQGADDVPRKLVLQAADITEGERYEQDTVDDAQRSIFSLGVFSSVRIEPKGDKGRVVDLLVTLQRGRVERWNAGVGMMSGTLRTFTSADPANSTPQWDVHLKGGYENRNLFGGLRHLTLDERPRLIFLHQFPGVKGGAHIGNLISALFEQPSTFEARTKLFASAVWDAGPDPYQGYFRHDITMKVGLERPFWKHRILAHIAVENDFYDVTSAHPTTVEDYKLPFLEQLLTLDLRNDPQRTKRGIYVSGLFQEASKLGSYGTWDYIRFLPEARGYVPLMWDFVLAARFAIASLVVLNKEVNGTEVRELGPDRYRLRGGGAFSNRGFPPGKLGDGIIGGTRRWEGSLELRIPLGGDFGAVLFGDVGDVHTPSSNEPPFRFDHLNTAVGWGLRYRSILGALRLDMAWRIVSLQVIGGKPDGTEPTKPGPWPEVVHFAIGEAF